MVLDSFDSVKAEMAIAVRNFSRRRKLKWVSAFCVFLFLFCLSSTWFSFVSPFLRQIFRRPLVVLNHVYVFMFFNAMIFVVYSLSGFEKRTENKSAVNRNDEEVAKDGEPSHGITAVGQLQEHVETPADDSVVEKRVVRDSNVVSPVDEVAIAEIREKEGPIPRILHSNSITEIIPQAKRYRRTESERYEHEHRETNKLRRSKSNTVVPRESETSGGEPPRLLRSVTEMDIDDFNRTIETFIAEKKFLQREEFREEQIAKQTLLALTCSGN